MRIVSLLPSATEIVHALGAGNDLVGRSEECDYPETVRGLPEVMRAKVRDTDRSSREIDERVRANLRDAESLYELDLERLRSLRPDVLLTQDLCRVCSVTDAEVEAACAVAGVAPRVVSLSPRCLSEVWESVEITGRAIGRPEAGRLLSEALTARAERWREIAPRGRELPKVAILEWVDPPILAGLWAPDMVAAAGGRPVGDATSSPARRSTWEEIGREGPDLVVVSPCSFPIERTRRDAATPGVREGLRGLAPRLGIWLADEAYFSRPGPRLSHGVDLLAALLTTPPAAPPMPLERWNGAG